MDDLSYPVEKFSSAAYGLAISPRSIQERVADAFTGELINAAGHAALPADVAQRFQVYQKAWSAVEDTAGTRLQWQVLDEGNFQLSAVMFGLYEGARKAIEEASIAPNP